MVGEFFTPLPLGAACELYDEFCGLSRRRYVAANFAEARVCGIELPLLFILHCTLPFFLIPFHSLARCATC